MREYGARSRFTIGADESIVHTVFEHARRSPQRVLFSRPIADEWVDVTAAEFADLVTGVAKGLVASGVAPGDRVVLLSATRFEWTLFDFAIWAAGAVSVPIYDSSSPEQVQWIVEDSGAVLAIVERAQHAAGFADAGPGLTRVLQIEDRAVEKLIAEGAGLADDVVRQRIAGVSADDLASLVYTSGTTGRPKGCILTHRNFLSEVRGILVASIGEVARPGNRMLTFLPLAHVLARAVSLAMFEAGGIQAHWSNFGTVAEQFERFRPNVILGVPRVFEKVRDSAAHTASKGGPIVRAAFAFAESTAIEYSESLDAGGPSFLLKARHALADRLVFRKLRAAMGDECWWAISGGGALMPRLGHFFRGAGIPIFEGYGLTESTAAHCVNVPGEQKIGTVGRPMSGNSVRIAADGEIELAGGVVFGGYWRNEEATADVFDDGWMRTGDLGELDDDGYLILTGRKKDLLVTAGGKNVSPGPLEDRLRSNALISQAVVVGDGRPFIGALLTLDPEPFENWKASNGKPVSASVADLADDPDLRGALQAVVDDANASVSHAEAIKRFAVLPHDLTEESGELTATLKIKRNVVSERFADQIASIYRSR
ncbi:AMP-dependent synthetase/ligase [Prescottella equi]|uniref:AMP-dependent synthetase/ligase n=1 Tax=Rhodococcus hoagii TaxID=43767 RepID=UPI000A10E613|nr:long-chain fatty acid--CoA ligase [Prescottella equi]ORM01357.1 long-chain fatty acid--CoA ligase [Prescottella equi]